MVVYFKFAIVAFTAIRVVCILGERNVCVCMCCMNNVYVCFAGREAVSTT